MAGFDPLLSVGACIKTHKTRNVFCIAPVHFAIKDTAFAIIYKRWLSQGIVLCLNRNCQIDF